jgi:hypothetical protein
VILLNTGADYRVLLARVEEHRFAMSPVFEQRLRDQYAAHAALSKPQPELPILVAVPHVFGVASDRFPMTAPVNCRDSNEVALPELARIERLGVPDVLYIAEQPCPRVHKTNIEVGFEQRHGFFEVRGSEPIVSIETANVAPSGSGDTVISR